eukprot:6187198-Pleurochrysis_carterae.AAC.1
MSCSFIRGARTTAARCANEGLPCEHARTYARIRRHAHVRLPTLVPIHKRICLPILFGYLSTYLVWIQVEYGLVRRVRHGAAHAAAGA